MKYFCLDSLLRFAGVRKFSKFYILVQPFPKQVWKEKDQMENLSGDIKDPLLKNSLKLGHLDKYQLYIKRETPFMCNYPTKWLIES